MVNAHFVPYEQNYELQQLTNALIQQSNNELFNISKSLGFMVDMGGGCKVFTPLSEIYNGYLDNAITMVASGAFDYNTMIRKVVGEMTASGLRTVDYASGHSNRVDVAVRRALLTGMSQLTGHISDMNGKGLEQTNLKLTGIPASGLITQSGRAGYGRANSLWISVDLAVEVVCWDGTAGIHIILLLKEFLSEIIQINGWKKWTGRKPGRLPTGGGNIIPMKPHRNSGKWKQR